MSGTPGSQSFYIGWDVGGWNCDKNPRSRDAIVILDDALAIVGAPWRGNLRESIIVAATTSDWVRELFTKCRATCPDAPLSVTMAIDTPLGFSDEFVNLVSKLHCVASVGDSETNPYLFRRTERYLFERGLAPLSAVKDMIGSQSTKGMHALAKFAPITESCGVWTDGAGYRAIESYPTACKRAASVKKLLSGRKPLPHADMDDALICALSAYLFTTDRNTFDEPDDTISFREGWIWVPMQTRRAN